MSVLAHFTLLSRSPVHAQRGAFPVLVCTDVAARGLDVHQLHYVLSFDCPKNIDVHVHRVGRTGREGQVGDGVAVTLLASGDSRFAGPLVNHLDHSSQFVRFHFLAEAEA